MKSSPFTFTILVSVGLVGMCIFLFPSTLLLYRIQYDADVGPGLVPMLCLAGITVLTVYTLIVDILKKRARSEPECAAEDGELKGSFLGIALLSIAFMGLYAFIWAHTNFIIGSLVFCMAMGGLCLPPERRTPRGIATAAFFLALFVLLVWTVFVKLLGVNLG